MTKWFSELHVLNDFLSYFLLSSPSAPGAPSPLFASVFHLVLETAMFHSAVPDVYMIFFQLPEVSHCWFSWNSSTWSFSFNLTHSFHPTTTEKLFIYPTSLTLCLERHRSQAWGGGCGGRECGGGEMGEN